MFKKFPSQEETTFNSFKLPIGFGSVGTKSFDLLLMNFTKGGWMTICYIDLKRWFSEVGLGLFMQHWNELGVPALRLSTCQSR